MNDPLDSDIPTSAAVSPADRLTESLLRYLDGDLTEREQESLAHTLRDQHDARETFVELCLDQAALAEVAPAESSALLGQSVDPAVYPSTTVIPMSPPVFWSLCAAVLVGLSLLISLLWRPSQNGHDSRPVASAGFDADFIATLAQVTQCRWDHNDASFESGARLSPSELGLTRGVAEILFDRGTRVVLDGPARFTPLSDRGGYLHRGRLVAHSFRDVAGFAIQTPAAIVVGQEGEFGVWVDEAGASEIHVFAGAVEIAVRQDGEMDPARYIVRANQSRRIESTPQAVRAAVPIPFDERSFVRSLPRTDLVYPPSLVSYWNFDEQGGPAGDLVGRNDGALQGVTRAAGLVGRGAVRFDDRPGQMVHVGSGDGSFACRQGITIEALFVSRFVPGDGLTTRVYDEIFRKDDGRRRILLSFQNDGDSNAEFSQPAVPPGPVLSFGLNIAGEYRELDMPLDGQEGRPTFAELTDGAMHHVVATYDAASGEKTIYLDGVKRYSHRYPPGSALDTQGDRPAVIGNLADHPWEAFHGVLDEVAIYNAALAPDEIAEHHRRVQQGRSYFAPSATSEEKSLRNAGKEEQKSGVVGCLVLPFLLSCFP